MGYCKFSHLTLSWLPRCRAILPLDAKALSFVGSSWMQDTIMRDLKAVIFIMGFWLYFIINNLLQ
jgi:hypothetical protein